jgi:hypothetical protein
LIGKECDGLSAVAQIFPKLFSGGRSRESTGQADDRNVDILPWIIHREILGPALKLMLAL